MQKSVRSAIAGSTGRAFVLAVIASVTAGLAAVAVATTADAATVGAGSYTETLPAGAALPAGCGTLSTNPRQFLTAGAPAGPVPTNDWWSSLVFKKFDCSYSENLHAHPISYDTGSGGLGFSYNTTPQISGSATGVGEYHYVYAEDFTAGVAGLNAPKVLVDDWSDWTVTPYWSDGTRTMKATIGHGLPFAYFQITGGDAQITAKSTPTVWSNSGARIGYSVGGKDYVAYAPTGATWSVSGTVISSSHWFTASEDKSQRVFYYDRNWGTLIGYPASYGSDQELNDHHFHYGYFIAAAATLAKFDPQWASTGRYGGMVDLLIRDANNYDRADTRFPYLRDFDIYAGHDWAAGHGAFFAGNNQESSSEGMNYANALIQWGQATGNTAVRDAGIFIWTTQSAAINEYWFDIHNENFPEAFGHGTVGMVWGDGGAYSTWFTAAPEMIQGINMLPITGGHFYLGTDPAYVRANYAEVVRNAGREPAVWQDILWSFLALGDGDAALTKFRANAGYTPEEGESRAHTFHWIRNLAALGTTDTSVTADHPLARVFVKNGVKTYAASNITAKPLTVTFSDGRTLTAAAGRTATAGGFTWSGGDATGGGVNPTPTGTTPTPTEPTGSPTPTPTVTTDPTPTPTTPGGAIRFLQSGGALAGTAGTAGTLSVPKAGHIPDDQPHDPVTFTATGLTLTHRAGVPTAFDLAVDAGTTVGNATQVRVSYDLTGDGSFDRVETYRYFALDPVTGWERYRETAGLAAATGTLGNLANGTVRVEIWSPIGSGPSTVSLGSLSTVQLPYQ